MPYYEFKGHRSTLLQFFDKRERAEQQGTGPGLKAYWEEKNTRSIDGIPGLQAAPEAPAMPKTTDVMKRAEAAENGRALANGSAAAVKTVAASSVDRRRIQEWAVAFSLGLAAAAVYVRAANVA